MSSDFFKNLNNKPYYSGFDCSKCLNNKICIYADKTGVFSEIKKNNLDDKVFEISVTCNRYDPKQIQFQNNI